MAITGPLIQEGSFLVLFLALGLIRLLPIEGL